MPITQATTLTKDMKILDSIEIKNQNITLLNLNSKGEDKVVLCINGIKSIFAEDKEKTINNAIVKVINIKTDQSRIRVESNCKDCIINDNNDCFHECNLNLDCNDNNNETIDTCIGNPRKCFYTEAPITISKDEIKNLTLKEEHKILINIERPEIKKESFYKKVLNWLTVDRQDRKWKTN